MSFKIECECPICERNEKKELRSFAIGYIEEGKDILSMTCNSGHTFEAILAVPKFAFMYENGLTAFNAGFYFEAFSCFYSSLELFRIDFIKAYFIEINSHEPNLVEEQLKYIKYSERIYGIYMMCYGLYFKDRADAKDRKNPNKKYIDDDDKKLRNNVYHAGKIITRQECADIGYRIYDYIRTIYQDFKEIPSSPESDHAFLFPAIMNFNANKARILQEQYPSALVISSDIYTSLSLNTDFSDDNLPSFDDLLAINNRLNKRKDITELIVNSEYFREQ